MSAGHKGLSPLEAACSLNCSLFCCAMQSRTGWLLDHQVHKQRKLYISILPAIQPQGIIFTAAFLSFSVRKGFVSRATGVIHYIIDMVGFSEHGAYFSGYATLNVRQGKYTLPIAKLHLTENIKTRNPTHMFKTKNTQPL